PADFRGCAYGQVEENPGSCRTGSDTSPLIQCIVGKCTKSPCSVLIGPPAQAFNGFPHPSVSSVLVRRSEQVLLRKVSPGWYVNPRTKHGGGGQPFSSPPRS